MHRIVKSARRILMGSSLGKVCGCLIGVIVGHGACRFTHDAIGIVVPGVAYPDLIRYV